MYNDDNDRWYQQQEERRERERQQDQQREQQRRDEEIRQQGYQALAAREAEANAARIADDNRRRAEADALRAATHGGPFSAGSYSPEIQDYYTRMKGIHAPPAPRRQAEEARTNHFPFEEAVTPPPSAAPATPHHEYHYSAPASAPRPVYRAPTEPVPEKSSGVARVFGALAFIGICTAVGGSVGYARMSDVERSQLQHAVKDTRMAAANLMERQGYTGIASILRP